MVPVQRNLGVNEFQRQRLRRASRWKLSVIALVFFLFATVVFSTNLGFAPISFSKVLAVFWKQTPLVGVLPLSSEPSVAEEIIVLQVRLPRVVGGALVGAALAAAGVVFQGIFRNPMADPYVIGSSAGAALGAASAIVLGVGYTAFGVSSVSALAFIGALASVLVVYNIARVGSRVPVTTLLLAGITVSIFLSAIVGMITVVAGERLHALIFWLMGGLSYMEWGDVTSMAPLLAVGIAVISLYARDLNMLLLGEETAKHLGADVEKFKLLLLIFATLITAAAVSVSGLIGFVGLIIPHLMRMLVGPDHRILIPASLIMGATFLMLCDALARVVFLPGELPVGIITALGGGPFFIYLLRKKRETYAF
ncbi:MAG: FecCD family ABC transporter permease [Candidatus Bathyarchaeia archaeon]